MNKIIKLALKAFGVGVFCALLFMLAQVATYTTFAQIPTTSPGGALNAFSDSLYWVLNTDSAGTRKYFPGSPAVTPPSAASAWTLISSGSATKADSAGSVLLSTTSSINAAEGIVKAVPGGAYTRTFAVNVLVLMSGATANDSVFCGPIWTNGTATSSSFQWERVYVASGTAPLVQVAHFTSFAYAGAGNDIAFSSTIGLSNRIYFRLQDDTVNRIFFISTDGINFTNVYSVARTSPFTPTNYGVACGGGSVTGEKWAMTLLGDS